MRARITRHLSEGGGICLVAPDLVSFVGLFHQRASQNGVHVDTTMLEFTLSFMFTAVRLSHPCYCN